MAAPAATPPTPPSATAPPPAPPVPPARTGEVRDAGAARHDAIRAQRWTAQGAAKVLGDVEVDVAELSGLASIRGAVRGGSLSMVGTLDVGGAVDLSGALSVDGEGEFGGTVRSGSFTGAGTLRLRGGLTASTTVRTDGSLEVHGRVDAKSLEFRGRLQVDEEIAVAELTGSLKGDSAVRSIRADRITLRRGGRFGARGRFVVTTIEAKDVTLEDVDAEYVRADRVVLGPGAQVARVDGTIASQHASAHVGPVSRTPKPYGLSR